MRPYLAIVSDSFREALHSRVLWLLGIVITLVLAALAPLGYEERLTIELTDASVRDWPQFLMHVRDAAAASSRGPAHHIQELLDEDARKKLANFKLPDDGDFSGARRFVQTMGELREELNAMLRRREFYDAKAWSDKPLASEEGRVLLQRGVDKLNDQELARLNRLLLEAAFPEHVDASDPVSLQIRYAVWDAMSPLPFRRDQFTKGIETAMSVIMKYFVGVIGVIIAVLVTASVIPQMFDPGSLNLLLSKPISRSLLFLSKFFGGCAFILINASYLITGLWLILGMRFGIWDAKLLLTIPIYLFMFAIYYTVSALAGVIWRNAIVSVALSVLFWLVCFSVGISKWLIETRYIDKQRIVRVIPAGDQVFAVNEMGVTLQWEESTREWKKVFQSDIQRQLEVALYFMDNVPAQLRPIGPIYDPQREQLLAVQRSFRTGQMTLYSGKKGDQWASRAGPTASIGTEAIVQTPQGDIVDVSNLGIFRLVGDGAAKPERLKVFGFAVPIPAADPFSPIGPDPPVLIARPSSIAMNPDSGELAIYSRGMLTLLRFDEKGRYERRAERKVELEAAQSAIVAWTGQTVLLGSDDGVLTMYDADTLAERGHWTTDDRQPPRFIDAAPGGRYFAVTLHGDKLWIVDAVDRVAGVPRFANGAKVSGASCGGPDEIYVVDKGTRVSKYKLSDESLIDRRTPTPALLDLAYDLFFLPVYTICPKPGDLDDTVTYLLSGSKTVEASGRERSDLTTAREQLNPWAPVWSSAAFVAVMLVVSCFYLERQEF